MSNRQDLPDSIMNAFDYISRVYREASYLLKTFQEKMDEAGFDRVKTDHGGELSYSLDLPDMWMPRYLSMYWRPKAGCAPPGHRKIYAGVTVAFFAPQGRAIHPVMLLGVVRSMDDHRAGDARRWLWYAAAGHEGRFTFTRDCEPHDRTPLETVGELIGFTCALGDGSYVWPKAGYVRAVGLTGLTGVEDVAEVVTELSGLWERCAGELAR